MRRKEERTKASANVAQPNGNTADDALPVNQE